MIKRRLFISLIAALLLSVSCSGPNEDKKEKSQDNEPKQEAVYYSGKLSDEEKQSAHLSLNLSEKVVVDADVTELSQYQDGLNSYFVGNMKNDKRDNISSYCKKPDIFGTSLEEFEKDLIEAGQCKLSGRKKKAYYDKKQGWVLVQLSYRDSENTKRRLFWERNLTAKNTFGGINGLVFSIDDDVHNDETKVEEGQLGEEMTAVFPDYDMGDLSFGKKEEIGERLKGFVEKTMKMDLSDKYDCMPISQATYRLLTARFYGDNPEFIRKFDSDYYYYRFYPSVDGFRWLSNTRRLSVGGEKLADDIIIGSTAVDNRTKKVTARSIESREAETQTFIYSEKGIREMSLYNTIEKKGVYKEKLEICPLETILTNVQEAFASQGVKLPTTIYNIELCYLNWFSDSADGEIRNIIEPCWMVEYWEQAWDGKRCDTMWVDGMTGRVFGEEDGIY